MSEPRATYSQSSNSLIEELKSVLDKLMATPSTGYGETKIIWYDHEIEFMDTNKRQDFRKHESHG